MSPAEYLLEIVAPTVRDASDDRRSRRKAYLACIAVYHLIDYLAVDAAEEGGTGRRRREAIEVRLKAHAETALHVVRGVTNGVKHSVLERPHVIPFGPGQDYWRPPARAGEMECGVSQLGDLTGGRQFEDGNRQFDIYWETRRLLVAMIELYPHHLPSCDIGDW